MEDFRAAVTANLQKVLQTPPPFAADDPAKSAWLEFTAPVRELAKRGKRTRALLVAAGFQTLSSQPAPLHAATAIELYQISALVHDDVIDDAETRRGIPAPHVAFAHFLEQSSFVGNPAGFGQKAAILLGDFLLSLSALEMENAEGVDAAAQAAGRQKFGELTAETAFGQYLDIRAEFQPLTSDFETAKSSALEVLLHKSARYSVELPLLIGAALAGAGQDHLDALAKVGRPLGIAFQLRDDELGVFASPDQTGKPAASDITEAKRTLLLALTREKANVQNTATIDSLLGQELSDDDVLQVRAIMRDSGAYQAHEQLIKTYESEALQAAKAFQDAPLLHQVIGLLRDRRS